MKPPSARTTMRALRSGEIGGRAVREGWRVRNAARQGAFTGRDSLAGPAALAPRFEACAAVPGVQHAARGVARAGPRVWAAI